MATSKIEIIKRAASATGNGGLVSIDDNAEIARLTSEHYEAIVEEYLTQHGWKFARRSAACQLTTITPELPWTQVWRKPVLLLSLQYAATAEGQRVDAEERDTPQGPGIAVNCDQTSLNAVGTYRVAEDRWPGDFAMAVQHRMEAIFLSSIAEQRSEAESREKLAEAKLQRARVRDQRASTASDPGEWDLAAARNRRGAWDNRAYR
ncbi:hypothetical protein KOAAANKH_02533 [Brevundimonas sp. NIBR10]|uniref:hypothetical protein n=1 Tax=Brevundimonas sp. NIBR10 TaxID=3015997 RepID=UPI0022F17078|nr:hypothetical protein [Brevundimonas sp. NIBR10]WGM47651.1 hypothetical protein KOAAANKH_02533 [Brevundimonas sp. NIBR10]